MIRAFWLSTILLGAAARPAAGIDLDLYATLLERHTVEVRDVAGVRVDYAAIASDPDWARLIESLEESDLAALRTREEKLGFWINAYNILAIQVVAVNYPVASIKDAGSFLRPVWKREAGRIDVRPYTLDQIEHAILRPMGEPRVHAAIVCASLSCPPLRREPFRPATLDAQLDDNARRWLADPRKGVRADPEAGVLWLSPILKWFGEDFEKVGGVRAFVARHAPAPAAAVVRERGESLGIRWLDYDWSLNDSATAPGGKGGA